ncbi:hypothetical protein FDECE_7194 [Fusarium decemcellulare]|nr:hypothetical protein FDECE_7194 [Fusarium decemcellulare]
MEETHAAKLLHSSPSDRISMDERAKSTEKTKFRRKPTPRVRTGCVTWIRHQKCDEEKPACRRCRDDRFKCDGYDRPPDKRKSRHRRKPEMMPLAIAERSVSDAPLERYNFHHFFQLTCKWLSNSSHTTNFWTRYALPLSQISEPVKHAIIAVGAAHRSFIADRDQKSPTHQWNTLAMHQYNKAISRMIPNMSLDSTLNAQCTLVCCLLFVAFEGIMGRYTESIRHLRAGNRLLALPTVEKDCEITKKITDMFFRLSVDATNFTQDATMPDLESGWSALLAIDDSPPEPFQDLDEAAYEIRRINVAARSESLGEPDLETIADQSQDFEDGDDENERQAAMAACPIQQRYHRWSARFQLTKIALGQNSSTQRASPQMLALIMEQKLWEVDQQPWGEEQFPLMLSFLDVAESLAHALASPNHATFSLDGDLISSLSGIIWVCSDSKIRQRALKLLRSLNRREGVWDSNEVAKMHETILSRENPEEWYYQDFSGGHWGLMAEFGIVSPLVP